MRTPCPWCLERLPPASGRPETCPRCGKPLFDQEGRELRPVDLRFQSLRDAQEARFGRFLTYGAVVAAAVGLIVPLTHLGAAALIPLMIVGHLVAVRLFLIRNAVRHLGPARRFFARWLTRLSFLWVGSIGYGAALVPVAGAAVSALTFAGLTWGVHNYVLWSLGRERRRLRLTAWEKSLLIVLAAATAFVVILAIVGTLALGWSFARIAEWAGE